MSSRQIEPAIFDLLDEYAEELRKDRVPLRKTVPTTSKLLAFVEGFFSQLYYELFEIRIKALDSDSKHNSVSLRHSENLSKEVARLMALFEDSCDTREDLIGASYGGGSTVVFTKFHRRTIPKLLKATADWAHGAGRESIASRAEMSLAGWKDGLAAVSW